MNISRSEFYALRDERNAYARCVNKIRETCALPDVPLKDLSEAVEQLLSELADRQIRRDIEPLEFLAGCDELVVSALGAVRAHQVGDPEDDEW